MQKAKSIDFVTLLGFEVVSDEVSAGVDFQDDIFAARLGAKVGTEICLELDFLHSGFAGNSDLVDASTKTG